VYNIKKIPVYQAPLKNQQQKKKGQEPRLVFVKEAEHPAHSLYHLSVEWWASFLDMTLPKSQNTHVVTCSIPVYGTHCSLFFNFLPGTILCASLQTTTILPILYEQYATHHSAMKKLLPDVISRNVDKDQLNSWIKAVWEPFKENFTNSVGIKVGKKKSKEDAKSTKNASTKKRVASDYENESDQTDGESEDEKPKHTLKKKPARLN
jgi:hypothetical protein